MSLFCMPSAASGHDARTLRQPHARALGANQSGELGSLVIAQRNLRGNSHLPLSALAQSRPLQMPQSLMFTQECNSTLAMSLEGRIHVPHATTNAALHRPQGTAEALGNFSVAQFIEEGECQGFALALWQGEKAH